MTVTLSHKLTMLAHLEKLAKESAMTRMDQEPDRDEPYPPTEEEQRAEAWEYWHERAHKLEAVNADMLAALIETLPQAEGCWTNHYGDNPEGGPVPHHIKLIRAAIALATEAKP